MVALSGGDKLAAALESMSRNVDKAAKVSVGFLEGATYPDGTSVALVAAINEYGRPDRDPPQPPRPFFRGMIADKSGEWPKAVGDLLKANDYDAAKTLSLAGEGIKGQLQQAIASYVGPPLSATTSERKGSDKQLVDTGHMLNSVDFAVE